MVTGNIGTSPLSDESANRERRVSVPHAEHAFDSARKCYPERTF